MIKIEIKEINPNTKLINFAGELDNATIAQVEQIVDPLVKELRTPFLLLVDLSKLTYLNSTGLAKLLQYHVQLRLRNGSLKLFGLSEFIREIMDICGALRVLNIYRTQEEAVK